ncbi:hypothetical protein BGZ73_003311 [Actinomortierella ambigua]|nr:hypothetical protein BGZ73_003311 [Actinomortierella ambigua]
MYTQPRVQPPHSPNGTTSTTPPASNPRTDNVMAEQQARLQQKYGSLPVFSKTLMGYQERKYFDSGDYALSLAGKNVTVGSEHPQPESIPHSIPTNTLQGSIPHRRGSLSNLAMQQSDIEQMRAL